MKVYQILENNDWNNQPESLSYLYKKQASLCEHFKYEMLRLLKLYPDDIDLSSMFSLSVLMASSYSSWLSLFIKYPTLKTKVDDVIDAKKKYENAGGKY